MATDSIKRSPDMLVYTEPGVTPYDDEQYGSVIKNGVPLPPPVVGPGYTIGSVSDAIADVVLK